MLQPDTIAGDFCRVSFEPFNLNSDTQIKEYFLANGWRPTEWNYRLDEKKKIVKDANGDAIKTSPKLTEDSFETIQGDVPKKLAERAILKHRLGLIFSVTRDGNLSGILNYLRPDGRVAADALPLGTPTGRYAHQKPVANIPKADPKILYGPEIRSLFTHRPGYVNVGCDAVNLEVYMKLHYTMPYPGGKEYADKVLGTDTHQSLRDRIEDDYGVVLSRGQAKGVNFAVQYGAQPPKIASMLGVGVDVAQLVFDAYWNENLPLSLLKEAVERAYSARKRQGKVYLKGLDGRKLFPRSPHSALNLLFQSAGSIVHKKATLFVDEWIKKEGLDANRGISYHDEMFLEVREDQAERLAELSRLAYQKSSEYFKLNIMVDGDPKIGHSWGEVHG